SANKGFDGESVSPDQDQISITVARFFVGPMFEGKRLRPHISSAIIRTDEALAPASCALNLARKFAPPSSGFWTNLRSSSSRFSAVHISSVGLKRLLSSMSD